MKKLLNLESKLKQQLNINSLLDYTQCSVEDIKKVFQSSFDASKSNEYADLVKAKTSIFDDVAPGLKKKLLEKISSKIS